MKQVIIGIHGMGNKVPKFLLEKWWKAAMNEGIDQAGCQKKLPEFEMVYWADILYDKPLDRLNRDGDSPYYLDEPYQISAPNAPIEDRSFRRKAKAYISEKLNDIFLNEDKTLNFSFITDAIMKKHFTDLDAYYTDEYLDETDRTFPVRDLIRERLVQVIKKYKKYEIMIVAHSMGSIITFDVLNFLIPEAKIHTLVTMGSPLGLPVVISKIAAEQKIKSNGHSIMVTPPGIRSKWYNLADIMDPVALNYKLSDDFLSNKKGIHAIDILVNNNYEMNGVKNPHKSFGYLQAPQFVNILSEFIADKKTNRAQRAWENVQIFVNKLKGKFKTGINPPKK